MTRSQVLVVGAGPTGLVLALLLTRQGVKVRIIDQAAEPGTTSRALVLHARTLEFYRQLGLAREVVERGLRFSAINLWVKGKRVGHANVADLGQGLSAFPYVLIFPQDEHERLLIDELRSAGVDVERNTSLLTIRQQEDGVEATLSREDGSEETCAAEYVAGCDGAHSAVREQLGIGFPGGTYQRVFYVADVAMHGPVANHELHVALDDADFLAIFPLKGERSARMIGAVNTDADGHHAKLTWNDVGRDAMARLQITADHVNWFSTYQVHHRVAEHFGKGRVFLLGDAAHVHSPVGGQGMNTGIGDAVNLGWKLAAVLQRRIFPSALNTYEPERVAFAQRLVASTDRAFTMVTRNGWLARWVRLMVAPVLIPVALKVAWCRRYMFRTLSQTLVNYRGSTLSVGRAGSVQAGDRLPWIAPIPTGVDNHSSLTAWEWQVHVYGDPSTALWQKCVARGLALHSFPWRREMGDAGLARDALYLVRPDGHVALADAAADPAVLDAYLREQGVRPRTSPSETVTQRPAVHLH